MVMATDPPEVDDYIECSILKSHLELAIKALEKIASTDYRGNRSQESVIAFKALSSLDIK